KIQALLLLSRPANVVTSAADVLAGIALSGILMQWTFEGLLSKGYFLDMVLLTFSTICLYAGGIVFNDVFDYELDKVERPERVIPRGVISLKQAAQFASVLLAAGILLALAANTTAGWMAVCIAIAALVYNKWAKHHSFFGPPTMGLCRGLNLLLGLSVLPVMVPELWYVALVPIIYISAITMISRGEVHGSGKAPLWAAALLYLLVIGLILAFAWSRNMVRFAAPFLVAFAWMSFKPLQRAIQTPTGAAIGKSVKAGVTALILRDAAWAASAGAWKLAVIICLMLPLSIWLSRKYAVT